MNFQEILSEQQKFYLSNKTKDISFRIEQLKKFKSVLKNNEKNLIEAIYSDFGKSEFETHITELSVDKPIKYNHYELPWYYTRTISIITIPSQTNGSY